MLSLRILRAMEREVIGQPRAVQTLTRAVTIGHSGLSGRESPVGMFLLLGPSGTGKTHVARSLARVLHGDTDRLVVVDCVQLQDQDDCQDLIRQIAPRFRNPIEGYGNQLRAMAPLSILLVEHLEAVRPEFVQALVAALETGRVVLPDGAFGSLRGCLVLMTSRICARDIFGEDRQGIGFSSGAGDLDEGEKARIYTLCCDAVERCWGHDFLGHLDDLIILHRLRESHLPRILDRFVSELNALLSRARIRIELEPDATGFLLEKGARFLKHGAWYQGKVFRRFVLFPIADLASSDRLHPGCRVTIGRDGDRLCFALAEGSIRDDELASVDTAPVDIPIDWNAPVARV